MDCRLVPCDKFLIFDSCLTEPEIFHLLPPHTSPSPPYDKPHLPLLPLSPSHMFHLAPNDGDLEPADHIDCSPSQDFQASAVYDDPRPVKNSPHHPRAPLGHDANGVRPWRVVFIPDPTKSLNSKEQASMYWTSCTMPEDRYWRWKDCAPKHIFMLDEQAHAYEVKVYMWEWVRILQISHFSFTTLLTGTKVLPC